MITTFCSKASGDVIMFGDVAARMLAHMGKLAGTQGIVTVEQLPTAIAGLEAAVSAEKEELKSTDPEELPLFEMAPDGSRRPWVSLRQRATPLLELMQRSLKKKVVVTWSSAGAC